LAIVLSVLHLLAVVLSVLHLLAVVLSVLYLLAIVLSALHLLAIVLSVLRFTDSDYLPLVYSNFPSYNRLLLNIMVISRLILITKLHLQNNEIYSIIVLTQLCDINRSSDFVVKIYLHYVFILRREYHFMTIYLDND
jgi:hypothetical protein